MRTTCPECQREIFAVADIRHCNRCAQNGRCELVANRRDDEGLSLQLLKAIFANSPASDFEPLPGKN